MYINSCFARNPQRDGVRSQRLTAVPAVLSNKKRKLKKIKVEKGFLCVSVVKFQKRSKVSDKSRKLNSEMLIIRT